MWGADSTSQHLRTTFRPCQYRYTSQAAGVRASHLEQPIVCPCWPVGVLGNPVGRVVVVVVAHKHHCMAKLILGIPTRPIYCSCVARFVEEGTEICSSMSCHVRQHMSQTPAKLLLMMIMWQHAKAGGPSPSTSELPKTEHSCIHCQQMLNMTSLWVKTVKDDPRHPPGRAGTPLATDRWRAAHHAPE
jgi:hypothetical protein